MSSCRLWMLRSLQISCVVALFLTFSCGSPWLTADPVSTISLHPGMAAQYPPPEWAKGFAVNHGKPIYFADHVSERPMKAAAIVALLVLEFLLFWGCQLLVIRGRHDCSWTVTCGRTTRTPAAISTCASETTVPAC